MTWIKFLRLCKDKVVKEVAQDLDISPATYSKYENNATKTGLVRRQIISEYFGFPIPLLFDENGWASYIEAPSGDLKEFYSLSKDIERLRNEYRRLLVLYDKLQLFINKYFDFYGTAIDMQDILKDRR